MAMLEKKYKCAGLCEVSLFYLNKDVSKGPPESSCMDAVVKAWSNNVGTAILFWSLAICLFVAAFGSCTLCKKDNVNERDESEIAMKQLNTNDVTVMNGTQGNMMEPG